MAAGDFHIRRNNADTSSVPNAGSGNEDAHWDTVVRENGSIVTYTDPNLQLDIGIYLIMYSERFHTDNTTNNERIEIQGEIHIGGTGVVGGYGQDYIRKSSGQQDCVVSGYEILEIGSDNTDVFIRFYRTDNSTSGTVDRVVNFGGVTVLELDTNDNYGLYSRSTTVSSSGTSYVDFTADTNDRQDTGFSNNGSGVITITTAGRYFATYSLDIDQNGTGREEAQGRITVNGTSTVEVGSYSACYLRGADGCQDGALTWSGIIDVAASDTLRVQFGAPLTNTTIDCTTGYFQLWQIPSGADEIVVNATNGDHNALGDFAWDTQPHIDTASFTYTNGNTNIDIDQEDYVLAFATTAQLAADTPQRPYPMRKFAVDDVRVDYAAGGYYHRNSGSAGALTVTVSALMLVGPDATVEMNIVTTPVSGVCTNDSGQFSILSLESLFGPYTFPPVITDIDTDEVITTSQANVVCTGRTFESVQGTGILELVENSDYTGTKVTQTIDSWADTSIQFDTVQGGLAEGFVYAFVTNDSGDLSPSFKIQLGVLTYDDALLDLSPDHYWRFNNTLNDTGITGPARNFSTEVGTTTYTTANIADGNSHALILNEITERIGPADSPNMNATISAQRRTLCMWIQPGNIQHPLGCIYKEGAQIQNMAFIMGYGNVVLAQMADTPGNPGNIQAWSDIKLTQDRPYHICMRYDFPNNFSLFLDGIIQTDTDGNPLGAGAFDSHVGDITIGAPDTTLETGGTDITYSGIEDMFLSDFASWSENSAGTDDGAISNTNIQDILFRRGAVPDDTIVSGTQAAMQTAIDATPDARPDWPLSYRIEAVTGGGDFELTMNSKTYDSRITVHLESRGADTLTIVNGVGSDFDSAKTFSAVGGTIVVVNEVEVKITTKDAADLSTITDVTRVLILAATGGDLPFQDSITITRSGSTATVTHTAHGLRSGLAVKISGAVQKDYNGIHTVTVTGANTYTYVVANSPTTPATGTITATSVIIDRLETVAGIISITDHRYTSDQPVSIVVAKGSEAPLLVAAGASGTIGSTGMDQSVFLESDA